MNRNELTTLSSYVGEAGRIVAFLVSCSPMVVGFAMVIKKNWCQVSFSCFVMTFQETRATDPLATDLPTTYLSLGEWCKKRKRKILLEIFALRFLPM